MLEQTHQALQSWGRQATEEQRRRLAALQLLTIRQLRAMVPKMAASQQRELRREEAWASARVGNADEARRLFAELRKESSQDLRLAEEHAQALMHLGSAADLAEAVAIWQKLGTQHKAGTAAWFEAKYQLAVALHRTGQTERATKVLRVIYEVWLNEPEEQLDATRRTYRRRFQELEKELRR
jgi:hypothetical protein